MSLNKIIRLAICLGFLLPALIRADMYVDRSIVLFEPGGQQRQDIKVSNSGDEVMYIQIEVFRVDEPGTTAEQRVKVDNPDELRLLATPTKLVIPAGGQKLVRIMNLEPDNLAEGVYRINVTPIVAPLAEEASQLRIIVAYQVLAIVQPQNPKSTLKVSRNGAVLNFENQGNTNILLSDGSQCDPADQNVCSELTSRRLYAGNHWQLDLPYDAPVAYSVRSFDGIKKQVFP